MLHEVNSSRAAVSGSPDVSSGVHRSDVRNTGRNYNGAGEDTSEMGRDRIPGPTNVLPFRVGKNTQEALLTELEQREDDYSMVLVELARELLLGYTHEGVRELLAGYETYMPARVVTEIRNALNELK